MIETFVKRPAMTIMLIMVFVLLGFVSFFNLLIERNPKVELPLVTIKTIYPGASPIEIETQIIKKVEDTIAEISQIKSIKSYAYENYGFTLIEFNIDADVNIKSIEVKDKVEAILNEFPDGAEKPEIAKFDPLIEPILDLVLESTRHNDLELYEYADKKLKNKLSVIEGVASIDLIGGKKRQINIILDASMMKKYFVSIDELLGLIASKNMNIPGGTIDRKDNTISVRFVGEYESVDEIANTMMVSRDGLKFRIKDIANVVDSNKKIQTISKFNGKNVVSLSIKKLSDGDAVSIAKKVKSSLLQISKELPNGMSLKIAKDTTTSIVSENYSTIYNIFIGLLLTILVLFIFLGNIKTTLIASIAIPTSLISAFFLLDFSNFSINMMSLLAIATSLGTLIANSLIIIENVVKRMEELNEDAVTASINGTKEVSVAIFASAGTNIVVFTPIAFMGGIIGQFMMQFGLTVVYVTLFSILASFSLTPMLCSLLLARGSGKSYLSKLSVKISGFTNNLISKVLDKYKTFFNIIMDHKFISITVILIFIISSFIPAGYLGSEFIPSYDNDIINIKIQTPQGSSLDQTKKVVDELESYLKKYPEIKNYLSYIGIDGYENAKIIVNLIPSEKRIKSDSDIMNELLLEVAKIPSATVSFSREEEGGGASGDIMIDVYGRDYDKLISLSNKMKKTMKETGFFRTLDSSYKTPKKEIRFTPNQKKMIYFGIKNADIATILRTSINGNDDNVYKENGEEYKINIELNDFYKQTLEDIAKINIITKDGLLQISDLGSLEWDSATPSIYRRDKQRVIQVYGYLSKSDAGTVQKILNKEFAKLEFPVGFKYKYSGNDEMFKESVSEIAKAFILAVILTYMLLVAILNSFAMPFVIATSIITSFITALLLEFYLEHSINIATLMSIIMLVGLVVNNAILMVDYALQKTKEGIVAREAIWLGAKEKLRTILMTSLAIIFGTLPQMFDKMPAKASIGSVIIGGMLGSIIFTFIITPIFFELFFNITNRKKLKTK